MERITYLVANYNCAPYVGECITSLATQDDPSWLCIICDDRSTDDSVAVIERELRDCPARDHFVFLRNERNLGYIDTLKKMIDAASTDIVGILDADDMLFPQATRAVLKEYSSSPDVGFVYSRYIAVDSNLRRIPVNSPVCSLVPPGKTALIYGFIGALRTFRKTVYFRTSGLDGTILYAEDRDLVYKLEEVAEPRFVDEELYRYRLVRGSQSTDEKKFRTGVINHVLARRNALTRRGVRGIDRKIHELINACLLARTVDNGFLRARYYKYLMKALLKGIQWTGHPSGRIDRARIDTPAGIHATRY